MFETFLIETLKNDVRTCKNIRKIATGQGDDYATVCLCGYPYFKVTTS